MEKEQLFALIVRCIDSIYFEDEVYNASDYKREELEEFLEGLDIKTFEKVQNFLSSSPKLEKKLEYTNSLGNKREIVLNTLSDFFTWR
jgi:tRNA(Ile)-lysidine synthase TilS/MesJ